MRRIAIVNQKGGVGKTTTVANLGAALALRGRRVAVVDLDPQGNLSTHLDVEVAEGEASSYGVLCEGVPFAAALRSTSTPGLFVLPADLDLSGAEMELAAAIGRESILRDALDTWVAETDAAGESFDYVIFDCPPSLGLLSVNGLVAAREVFITLQTEFFALKGMSKLVEIVQLLKRRLNPELEISGIIGCLYDSRLRLAREVLAEIRRYFPGPVFRRTIRTNVKLAEAPSHGLSIFDYAPGSAGAGDYAELTEEVIAQERGVEPEVAVEEPPVPEPVVEELGASEALVEAATEEPVEAPVEEQQAAPAEMATDQPTDEVAEVETPDEEPAVETPAVEVAAEVEAPMPEDDTPAEAPVDIVPQAPPVAAQEEPAPEEPSANKPEPHPGSAPGNTPRFERRAPNLDTLPRAEDLPPLPADAFRTPGCQ